MINYIYIKWSETKAFMLFNKEIGELWGYFVRENNTPAISIITTIIYQFISIITAYPDNLASSL